MGGRAAQLGGRLRNYLEYPGLLEQLAGLQPETQSRWRTTDATP